MFRTLFIGLGDFGEKVASYTYSEFYNEHSNLTNANALLTLNKELCTTFGDSEKKTITSLDFEENEYAKNLKYLKSKHEVSLALEDSFDFVSSIEFGMGAIADGVDVEVNEQRIIIYFSIGDSVSSVSIVQILKLISNHRVIRHADSKVYLICGDHELLHENYKRATACLTELDYHLSDMQYVVSLTMLSKFANTNFGSVEADNIMPLIYNFSKQIIYNQTEGFTNASLQNEPLVSGNRIIYNSFGCTSLRYDKDKVWQKFCDYEKLTYLNRLVNGISDSHFHRTTVTGPVNQFILNKSLSYIQKRLKEGEDGNTLLIDVAQSINSHIRSNPPETARFFLDILKTKDEEYHANTWQEITPKIGNNINVVQDDYKTTLKKEILTACNGESGLAKLKALLNILLKQQDDSLDGHILDDECSFEDLFEDQLNYFKKLYLQIPIENRDADVKEIISQDSLNVEYKEIVNCEQTIEGIKAKIVELDRSYLKKDTGGEVVGFEEGFFTIGGEQININGFVQDDFSNFSDVYEPNTNTNTNNSVDLRKYLSTEIENQGLVGSCVTNAITSALEYISNRATGKTFQMSRLFLYYNARVSQKESDSGVLADKGCSLLSALSSAQEMGVCLEQTWPYDISKINEKPSATAYVEAEKWKVDHFQLVKSKLNDMISCLDDGYPFVFGLRLTSSFNQLDGKIPIPEKDEMPLEDHPSHAMLCVGYSKKDQVFIVRNSWGVGWGDKGYCYIPFDYMTNPDMILGICTIRSIDEKVNEIVKTNIWGHELGYFNDGANNAEVIRLLEKDLEKESDRYSELKQKYENKYEIWFKQNELFKQISFRNDIKEKLLFEKSLNISEKANQILDNETFLKSIKEKFDELNARLKRFLLKYILSPVVLFFLLLIGVFWAGGLDAVCCQKNSFLNILGRDFLVFFKPGSEWYSSVFWILFSVWLVYGIIHFYLKYFRPFQELKKLRKETRIKDRVARNTIINLYSEKWQLKFDYYVNSMIFSEVLPHIRTHIEHYKEGLTSFIDHVKKYREDVSVSYRETDLKETVFCQRIFNIPDQKKISNYYKKEVDSGNLHLDEDIFQLDQGMLHYLESHINGDSKFKNEVKNHWLDKKSKYIKKFTLVNLLKYNYFNINEKMPAWNRFLKTFSSPLLPVHRGLDTEIVISEENHMYFSNEGFNKFSKELKKDLELVKHSHNDDNEFLVFRYLKGFPAYAIDSFFDRFSEDDLKEFFIYSDVSNLRRN